MPKIAIVGPESTGKSWLSGHLARKRGGVQVPEVARQYLENLNRAYTKADVLEIARQQMEAELQVPASPWIFLDTNLLILQVWMEVAYQDVPDWIPAYLQSPLHKPDFYLLCYPDIPWEPDPLREHPGMREQLFERYKELLHFYKLPFGIVKGEHEIRIRNAEILMDQFFENQA